MSALKRQLSYNNNNDNHQNGIIGNGKEDNYNLGYYLFLQDVAALDVELINDGVGWFKRC